MRDSPSGDETLAPKVLSRDRVGLSARIALRPREAAAALGVSDRTLRKWVRDEGLPYFKLDGTICIPVADLERWMADRRQSTHRSDEIVDEILRDF